MAFMVRRVDETTESQSIPLVDSAPDTGQGGTQAADGDGASAGPAACTLDELEQQLGAFSQQTKASRTQHRVTPARLPQQQNHTLHQTETCEVEQEQRLKPPNRLKHPSLEELEGQLNSFSLADRSSSWRFVNPPQPAAEQPQPAAEQPQPAAEAQPHGVRATKDDVSSMSTAQLREQLAVHGLDPATFFDKGIMREELRRARGAVGAAVEGQQRAAARDSAPDTGQGGTQAADGDGASAGPAACTLDELEQQLRAFSQQTKASRTQHRVTPAAAASTVSPPALQCTS